ncbi:4Fe-4S dicluster domain-containing protein [Clostridium cavendishii DSM 21758]|uniref:4Fe-4S dicluster domain-containing protein n=1 Tax=Clostridium cavendishii DSM 21758 TaxID=1121302 RepID=A0A1M6HKH1_9CLOT|nr:EFR1 family ferrodoxin [Clostridium cavendishii]SHJ22649.1 4Fe-4S dicluster domain-containing protein [Clostridium cavendishii DSM 21758]
MEIVKDTMLYFSGTGNSLQVSKDINNELNGFDLIKITDFINEDKIVVRSGRLGIVFPVYYARMPLIVEEGLKKLEVSKSTYIFAVATCGGAPSNVLLKLAEFLKIRNIKMNAGFLVKMPRNNIFSYSSISVEKQKEIFKEEKGKIKEITKYIKNKVDCSYEVDKLFIVLFDQITGKITDKIMSDFHYRDKYFWTNEKCNGCGLCKKVCSVKNIDIVDNKSVWENRCEQCTACIQYCPQKAIQWKENTVKRSRYRNPNISVKELI